MVQCDLFILLERDRKGHQQGLTRGVSIVGEDLADIVDVMIEQIRLQFKTVSRSQSSFSIVVEFLWREKTFGCNPYNCAFETASAYWGLSLFGGG